MTPGVRAILDALCFDGRTASLGAVTADDLAFADRSQLTLQLWRFDLAPLARSHVDSALVRNSIRTERIAAAYGEIAPLFDHVQLKGATHSPDFVEEPRLRAQYDLDLYVPTEQRELAREALLNLGYEPIGGVEGLAMDHLPAMVRKTGWQWRGDYFDPDLPPSIEVHFRFWDEETERLSANGVEEFWTRRDGARLPPVDRLGYASLHLTRHLLRGNVRAFHVWEIARFLHLHHDADFWRAWRSLHSPSLRRLEAVAFLLAQSWFACDLPAAAAEEVAALPPRVHRWFQRYRWSALESISAPNKHELWLHLSLVDSAADRAAILRRRLIPSSMPGPIDAIHVPKDELTLTRRLQRAARNSAYAASRAFHHARLFVPTLFEGARWWLTR